MPVAYVYLFFVICSTTKQLTNNYDYKKWLQLSNKVKVGLRTHVEFIFCHIFFFIQHATAKSHTGVFTWKVF